MISLQEARATLGDKQGRLFIGGDWVEWDGPRFDQLNPNDNQPIGSFAEAGPRGVDMAVAAARRAFDQGPWPTMPAQDRKRILQPIIEQIYALEAELAMLQTLDNGMPYSFSRHSRASGKSCADILDHHAGWCDKITGATFPRHSASANLQYLTFRDPVGVVGAILAWNVPLNMFAIKVGPALASGCTVVLKPSEYTNLAVTRLVEIFAQSDLPPGVVNFVTGGPETGAALSSHPGVDKVTFTGSAAVGERIVAVSGANMKRLSLELGGKSAGIVFPQARSVAAAATNLMGLCSTFLSGQVCTTPSRALVHRSVFDEFVHHATEQVKQVRFGDPFDPATTSAPIISRAQVRRIRALIDSGTEQGARLAFGGGERQDGPGGGNWMDPALFVDVDPAMRIAREEFFGPVLCAIPFDTEEQAIGLANDSEYGLAGCIFTTDISQGLRVARSVRTGAIGINGYASVANAPMGGVKRSGLGREGGWASIDAFTEIKTVAINLDG